MTTNSSPIPRAGDIVEDVRNRQDVAFVTDMIRHHRQTIAMVGLVSRRTSNPKVQALANKIESEQAPEIAQIVRWLTEWHQPLPNESARAENSTMGMLSAADIAQLQAAKNDAFDRLFLTLMITHHEGCINQARGELRTGADERVKGFADDIVDTQSAEITEMRQMLASMG